ncbi:MAG: hypothetical protein AAF658_17190, partial [Myxococcota bacterium]
MTRNPWSTLALASALCLAACNSDPDTLVVENVIEREPESEPETETEPEAEAEPMDTDRDGLSDQDELEIYGTSPSLVDTDGDGLTDGAEVVEFGFDPSANRYRFNPLIADLPQIEIAVETVPSIDLLYTATSGETASTSNSSGGKTVEKDSRTFTGGVSVTLGVEVGTSAGLFDVGVDVKKSASVTGSFSTSETEATENHNTWSEVTSNSASEQEATSGASIRVGVSLENVSNLAFTVDHLTLVAYRATNDGELLPIATLGYDSFGGGFQPTSFAPGQQSNILLFSNDALDLGTALDLLKDSRSLVVDTALLELTDSTGRPLAFDQGDVFNRTVSVLIDYGTTLPRENYGVATLGSRAGGSLNVAQLLEELAIPVDTTNGLTSVREIVSNETSRWVINTSTERGLAPLVETYDPARAPFTLEEIQLFAGDEIALVYLTDADGDGLGIREEFLNGTDPESADTDGDGRSDLEEV